MNGSFELAQFNIALMRHSRHAREMDSYHEMLEKVVPVASSWPGFRWSIQDDDIFERTESHYGPRFATNLSGWATVESPRGFMDCALHAKAMGSGKDWFAALEQATYVFWWVRSGCRPTFDEACERLETLRRLGATELGFTLDAPFPPPGETQRPIPAKSCIHSNSTDC